ncbi:ABC multidrug transporter-like protein [Aureobasidium pullulans]|uniref:ABC multidrug transporter-like protein n=1 Tax=Aureobasidium pullulans TaxID=5580 RepID=A0A4S9SXD8_AURPU|nr:ABC multidrug transporter-like protein [Aureobasidium pullulans]
MSAPVPDTVWTSGDAANPPPAADTAQHGSVATEPLERVGTERELNEEKVLDRDYVRQKEAEQQAEKHGRSPLDRHQSDWTSSSNETPDDKSQRSIEKEEKQTWSEKINPLKSKHKPPIPTEQGESREYKANFFSHLTFQWMAPIMSVGYQRPLELNDLWKVNPDRSVDVLSARLKAAFKKRVDNGTENPLKWALYDTFRNEFLLGGFCELIAAVVQVLAPFVLRYLINFSTETWVSQRTGSPKPDIGHGIGLVFAVTILQVIQSVCTNHFLYRGMTVGGQARAVTIAVIFEKAMRLSGRARAGGKSNTEPVGLPPGITPGSKEEKKWLKAKLKKEKANAQDKKGVSGSGEGWSNGRIVNLMSTDTYRIDQASGMFHMIWASPISIVLTLVLLLVNITYSALAGFGLLMLAMPLLGRSIKSLFVRRKAINKVTDQRVGLTQEILAGVRFVKYFGWESSFLDRLKEIRRREIGKIQFLLNIRNGIMAVSMSMPVFASMLAFITYSLTDHGLQAGKIFSSLALFNGLRLPLNLLPLVIGQTVDASASIRRIEDFLLAEEALDEATWDYEGKSAIVMKDADFTWERTPTQDAEKAPVGPAGSKQAKAARKADKKADKQAKKDAKKATKDALKNAEKGGDGLNTSDSSTTLADESEQPFQIKGLNIAIGRDELVAVIGSVGSGKTSILAALGGEMRRTSGEVTFGASRSYCPQYAWIQNATVKENITFGKPFDQEWYDAVVDACALRPDLDMLPNGDLTEIGERGITVSGGQKQRLNIARAIYFNADIVLMDDPLSAVDAHVGRHIMDNAICGLLRNKARVLATHQLHVLHRCDRIIWVQDGTAYKIDTFDNLMATDADFQKLMATTASEEKKEEQEEPVDEDEVEEEKKDVKKTTGGKKPAAALMQAEERAVKSVSFGIYKAYVKASGSLAVAPLILLTLILSQGANIATSLWLSWWTSDKFGYSRGAYIGVYAGLGVSQAVLMFIFSSILTICGTRASATLLHNAVTRVLRAPMSFFDTTPLGRITNRFSKDVDTMDNALTDAFRMFFMTLAQIIAVFILIIAYYYYFAAALGPLFIMFLFAASYYRSSAREIKRHEAVLRSSVFSRFSEAVSGVATIRAYGLQDQFSRSVRDAIDNMNGAYYLTFSNQRWLSVRLDAIGTLLVFVTGILVVTASFSVNPSSGGLVLSYILSVVQMIQFTVRQLAEVENNMNSTERIYYYGNNLEEEAPLHTVEVRPSWPEKGEIVFDNVQMRYREGLPLVLKGLNMHVNAGERIGVVGRTGAGKSTIMSTLFRLVELSGGSITVDGLDIAKIGLKDLRSRLSIIPQDPTLFKGTIRSNLDPFNEHTDMELWGALRQADLVGEQQDIADSSSRIHLDAPVEEEGLNFSLGQRQLMALARALVRGSRIIVCDEATSSVDFDTDQKIQRTIVKGFKGKTLLCIAHRLKTIIGYDRICVMDKGQIAELDRPITLYDQGGIFRSMCDRSGIRREDFFTSAEATFTE